MRVILYTKPGCLLCDELKGDLAEFQAEMGFDLTERNIEDDETDFLRYRYLIPVLDIEGGELLTPPHQWATVRAALERVYRRML